MICTCDHHLIDHHLNGWRGCKGQEGHGRCSVKECPCRGFVVAEGLRGEGT